MSGWPSSLKHQIQGYHSLFSDTELERLLVLYEAGVQIPLLTDTFFSVKYFPHNVKNIALVTMTIFLTDLAQTCRDYSWRIILYIQYIIKTTSTGRKFIWWRYCIPHFKFRPLSSIWLNFTSHRALIYSVISSLTYREIRIKLL